MVRFFDRGRRWQRVVATTFFFGLPLASLLGQAPAPTPSSLMADGHQSVLTRQSGGGYVRFYWCGGRLRVDTQRYRKGAAECHAEAIDEQLVVSSDRGLPSAMYRFTKRTGSETRTIAMDVIDAETVDLKLTDPTFGTVHVFQPPIGPIRVDVENNGEDIHFVADTWLHLYSQHRQSMPKVTWQFVDKLVPRYPIETFKRDVDRRLRTMEGKDRMSRAAVEDLVEQLRADRRGDRMAARRALMMGGSSAAHHLVAMEAEQQGKSVWDAEQSATIQHILRRVQTSREDFAGSLAWQLAGDPSYRPSPSWPSPVRLSSHSAAVTNGPALAKPAATKSVSMTR